MAYERKDRFFKKAKQESFVARSVYKLEELDKKFHLFKKGDRVVDLGCAPGSWLQYLAKAVGPSGFILGYDLAPVTSAAGANVRHFELDVYELTAAAIRLELRQHLSKDAAPDADASRVRIDALVSDMAPKLSGIRDADQARSIGLAEHALSLALDLVRPGGAYVAKLFQGRDTDAFIASLKQHFDEVKIQRPEATRDGSREMFVVARGRKAQA